MRTPWPPVTIIAAYADPCAVFVLIMIPALDHGWVPLVSDWPALTAPAGEYSPVSEVTRTVMLPSAASARCAKENWSTTGSPSGPSAGVRGVHFCPLGPTQLTLLPAGPT